MPHTIYLVTGDPRETEPKDGASKSATVKVHIRARAQAVDHLDEIDEHELRDWFAHALVDIDTRQLGPDITVEIRVLRPPSPPGWSWDRPEGVTHCWMALDGKVRLIRLGDGAGYPARALFRSMEPPLAPSE